MAGDRLEGPKIEFCFLLPGRKKVAGGICDGDFFRFLRGFWGIGEFGARAGRMVSLALAVWLWEFPCGFPL